MLRKKSSTGLLPGNANEEPSSALGLGGSVEGSPGFGDAGVAEVPVPVWAVAGPVLPSAWECGTCSPDGCALCDTTGGSAVEGDATDGAGDPFEVDFPGVDGNGVGDFLGAEAEVELETSGTLRAGAETSPSTVEVAPCPDSVAAMFVAPLACGQLAAVAPVSASTSATRASLLT